ncbi:MAG: nucleotidyltransferase family protein [Candidatus Riflebacteria bacterium]|nr:nucleotidyltransferase family protein [Candidatus Riflebacteria bacterium]
MSLYELLKMKRSEILITATKYGAKNVRIFGSVARGEERPESDVDFLVVFEKGRSLLNHAGLIIALEELLGCKVDVVSEPGLRERIRSKVLQEAIAL